jgi:hypothetical protein
LTGMGQTTSRPDRADQEAVMDYLSGMVEGWQSQANGSERRIS